MKRMARWCAVSEATYSDREDSPPRRVSEAQDLSAKPSCALLQHEGDQKPYQHTVHLPGRVIPACPRGNVLNGAGRHQLTLTMHPQEGAHGLQGTRLDRKSTRLNSSHIPV